jgi:hypothetical protein
MARKYTVLWYKSLGGKSWPQRHARLSRSPIDSRASKAITGTSPSYKYAAAVTSIHSKQKHRTELQRR